MIHRNAAVGPFEANCHVLADEDTREAIVLDPGSEPKTVLKLAEGLQVQTVLLTHGHIDHVSAVRDVVEATGAKVKLHRADRELYERLELQCASLSARLGIDLGPIHVEAVESGENAGPDLPTCGYLITHAEKQVSFYHTGDLQKTDPALENLKGRVDFLIHMKTGFKKGSKNYEGK